MKIFILGPSGAGTTTLGRKIAGELGILHQDSDDLFWEPTDPPFTFPRDAESLHEKQRFADRIAAGGDMHEAHEAS